MKKSKFNLSYLNSTTGNAGYLIPFLLQPTLPNDTFRFSLSSFIRAQPMVAPLMHEVKIPPFQRCSLGLGLRFITVTPF